MHEPPHLVRTYKVSKDPAFTKKVTDIVGLYLNPPDNAIVLSIDEKTQIQALERTQLPLACLPASHKRCTRIAENFAYGGQGHAERFVLTQV